MTLADYVEIETTKDELIRACKQAADLIRTRVDYDTFSSFSSLKS